VAPGSDRNLREPFQVLDFRGNYDVDVLGAAHDPQALTAKPPTTTNCTSASGSRRSN